MQKRLHSTYQWFSGKYACFIMLFLCLSGDWTAWIQPLTLSASSPLSTGDHTCAWCLCFKDILLIPNLFLFFFYLQALPQWVRMINDTQMDSGEKLQWECKAMGRPRPTYHWLRNGLPLTSQVPTSLHRTLLLLIVPGNIWIIPVNLHIHCMQHYHV